MNTWTLVIKPKTGWFDIHLSEIWRYRDLIAMFVKRDLTSIYKQTVLGPLWFLIQPVTSTVIFTIIFNRVADIPTDNIPPFLFYLSGNIVWGYFSACFTSTSNTFISNAGIFGKVYFPRLAVPIATVITRLTTFAIQFSLFLAFYLYFWGKGAPVRPSVWIILLPVLLVHMGLMGLGFGILTSSLTTKYRDFMYLMSFGVQLWMYATPIVYPLSEVPHKYQWLMLLNPMTAVVEFFRFAFLGQGTVSLTAMGISWGITLLVAAVGVVLFSRVEKTFMDTV